MNTPIAIGLAALVIICALVDGFANDWSASLFLARKTVDLLDYVAFWR
jgi:hypothetical protein